MELRAFDVTKNKASCFDSQVRREKSQKQRKMTGEEEEYLTSNAEVANLMPNLRLSDEDTDTFVHRTLARIQETTNFQICWTRRLTWWRLVVDVLAGFRT